ncbi:hypothetical protein I33_3572 [Bacillus subtilis subsp. subtilis str. RO-NN-1]|nr:hypothetical protein I33_3572 [Bacillus subtilis subsp. subtilis str. RO-NN-1]
MQSRLFFPFFPKIQGFKPSYVKLPNQMMCPFKKTALEKEGCYLDGIIV